MTAEHTAVRGCVKFWLASKGTVFKVAEKHSSNVSTLILCFASGHMTEKHGMNEMKTAAWISGERRCTWSKNAIKMGANGVRFRRGFSHALTRWRPSMSLQCMMEERSCQ